MLGQTWIVEKLTHALDLAHVTGPGTGFVTLKGQLLTPDGTLVVGPRQGAAGQISRRSDLRALKARLEQLEGEIKEAKVSLANLEGRIASQKQQLVSLTEKKQQADAALADGRFSEALALYQKAVDEETRTWVRRRIIAQWVWCYQALGQPVQAGEAFLLLIRSDPDTPYFDCIPLSWLSRQTPAALERAAAGWMQRQEPAAVLLGASHLLTGSQRSAALARLRQLAASPDARVAQLALAQSWRASGFNASEAQIDAWTGTLTTIPEPLAAGPYYVVGAAQRQRDQWQQAAIKLMRVVILHPEQRELAAQSLIDAGRCLEKLEQPRKAASLYQELLEDYPEQARPVAEAESRLEALQGGL